MQQLVKLVPRVAIFLAGMAAGAATLNRRREGFDPAVLAELKRSLADLRQRIAEQDFANSSRLQQMETRLDEQSARLTEHAERLADVPSTAQIVGAMEHLLQKTMASLDQRLTTQAHSIDVLKTTVSQTDSLLERVLESLDSLHTAGEPR